MKRRTSPRRRGRNVAAPGDHTARQAALTIVPISNNLLTELPSPSHNVALVRHATGTEEMMTITATDLTLGQAARPGNAAHRATPDMTALIVRSWPSNGSPT